MDININLSCCRNTDSDMTLGSRSDLDITMAPVAAQDTQSCMAPVIARSLDPNMV